MRQNEGNRRNNNNNNSAIALFLVGAVVVVVLCVCPGFPPPLVLFLSGVYVKSGADYDRVIAACNCWLNAFFSYLKGTEERTKKKKKRKKNLEP